MYKHFVLHNAIYIRILYKKVCWDIYCVMFSSKKKGCSKLKAITLPKKTFHPLNPYFCNTLMAQLLSKD